MIRLTGTLDSSRAPEPVRRALPAHIAASRSEPGCLRFEVREDPEHPGLFHVSESFTDQAAFDAHQTRTADSAWGRITAGFPRKYGIKSDT